MELGVCVAFDPLTQQYKFLLSDGRIVPRFPNHILPSHLIPFDWKPKPYLPALSPLPSSPNPVIQLPSLPADYAIRTISPLPTPALPHTLMSDLRSPALLIPLPRYSLFPIPRPSALLYFLLQVRPLFLYYLHLYHLHPFLYPVHLHYLPHHLPPWSSLLLF